MYRMKIRHCMALACAALLLGACTLSKIIYNNATPVLTWMADDYFDLSGPQKDWVRDRFRKAIGWHRDAELPEYDRFLRETLARTERTITVEDARWVHKGMRNYYDRLVVHLIPDAAEFIAQLEPAQANHFAQRFEEENAKIRREQMKPDTRDRQERRAKKMIGTIEGYTGRLNREQRELVATRMVGMTDVTALRLEDRRLRQQRVVDLIRARPPKPQMEAGLRHLLIDTEAWRKAEYLKQSKQRDEQLFEMTVALAATLTPEQKGSVQKKLRSYLHDVTQLMAMK